MFHFSIPSIHVYTIPVRVMSSNAVAKLMM